MILATTSASSRIAASIRLHVPDHGLNGWAVARDKFAREPYPGRRMGWERKILRGEEQAGWVARTRLLAEPLSPRGPQPVERLYRARLLLSMEPWSHL